MIASGVMARWRREELHDGLKNLIARVEAERQTTSGDDPRWGMTKKELSLAAGIAPRTYYRYLEGQSLPVNEKGVDGILRLAEAVGIDRQEAEAYLPEPLEGPVGLDNNGHILREIRDQLNENGAILTDLRPILVQLRDLLTRIAAD